MADDVARWAIERAPALLARAEAEAVAVLRDALVAAALPTARRGPAPAPPPAPPPDSTTMLWVYGIVADDATLPGGLQGLHGPVEPVTAAGLTALVGHVPGGEYGEEPLRRNLNDLQWLEHVARAHEAVLDRVLMTATLLPLRLCTIYASEDGVRRMLSSQAERLQAALSRLAGRQEWGVKLIVDPERLADAVRPSVPDDQPAASAQGAAYLLGRRRERRVRAAAEALAAELAERVHDELCTHAVDAVTRPPQNRELSGHDGDMLLNGSYLVEEAHLEDFQARAVALGDEHAEFGAVVTVTGPWPPYNFVPDGAVPLA